MLGEINPAMTFVYVSGTGTGGKAMWARVKKRIKDALLALFPSAYMIRLSALRPIHGEVSKDAVDEDRGHRLRPILRFRRAVAPGAVITIEEIGA